MYYPPSPSGPANRSASGGVLGAMYRPALTILLINTPSRKREVGLTGWESSFLPPFATYPKRIHPLSVAEERAMIADVGHHRSFLMSWLSIRYVLWSL
jgi:hypothetical protein